MQRHLTFAGALSCALLSGCGFAYPKAPPPATELPATLAVDRSTLSVPLDVTIRNAQQALNAAVPAKIGSTAWSALADASSDGFTDLAGLIASSADTAVFASGRVPTEFRFDVTRTSLALEPGAGGRGVRVAFNGSYLFELRNPVATYACAGATGKAAATASAVADVGLDLKPDWSLAAQTQNAAAKLDGRCTIGSTATVDLTPQIGAAYAKIVNDASNALAGVVRQVTSRVVRREIENAWTQLGIPYQVRPGVWFVLNPDNYQFAQPSFAVTGPDLHMTANFVLVAQPQVAIGTKPVVVPKPVPPLQPLGAAQGFHVAVDTLIPFAAISKAVSAKLNGTTVSVPVLGNVKIGIVRVYGTNVGTETDVIPKLVVQADFSGGANGEFYLVGTPSYDPKTSVISMPDLNFTIRTGSFWLRTFAPLIHSGKVVWLMREKARFDASEYVRTVNDQVLSAFNRKIVTPTGTTYDLSGKITGVNVGGIGFSRTDLVVRAVADGTAKLDVTTDADARWAGGSP